MFFKIGVLTNFTNFTGKHLYWNLFLIKLQPLRLATLLKETPTQVFSCKICEIFRNTLFYRTPPVAASSFMTSTLGGGLEICRVYTDSIDFE